MKNNIQLLDCTLRDGGHVNHANFGKEAIDAITNALSSSFIDLIELGFLRDGSFTPAHSNYNRIEDARKNLPQTIRDEKYTVMIRPDWYDITQLTECDGIIDRIRFAFYKKDIELTKRCCDYAYSKGYKYILNPVNVMGYDPNSLKQLIKTINDIHPFGVTIVDTFGSMQIPDLERIYATFEEYLSNDITIGLHLHENMASSYLLAQHFMQIKQEQRKAIIDGSLLGMGRVPGNLCIEMMLDYMNSSYSANYSLEPILRVITKYIEPIKKQLTWGYSPAYYFTGKLCIHRSYAEYLLTKKSLDLGDILCVLQRLGDDLHKTSFSKEYAEQLYQSYMEERKNEN